MKRVCVVGLVVWLAGGIAAAQLYDASKVSVARLKNGLKVIVKPEPYWGIVGFGLYARAGSVYDPEDGRGTAHMVEHLIFRGRRGSLALGEKVESLGAYINAETTRDLTFVQVLAASSHMGEVLRLIGRRLERFEVTRDMVEAERRVIVQEIKDRRTDATVEVDEALWMLAFKKHPYRWPIGGTPETVRGISAEAVRRFYERFYAPGNMALVVVGDVKPEEVVAVAERELGRLPAREVSLPEPEGEPPPEEPRVQTLHRPTRASIVAMAWRAPGMSEPDDVCAMDLVYTYLSDGPESWLQKVLVREKRLALAAACDFLTQRYPGLFIITAVCRPGLEERVRQAVLEKLMELAREPMSDAELMAIKQRLRTSWAFQNETYGDQAASIGFYEMIGSWQFAFEYGRRVQGISPEQLRWAVARYLNPNRYVMVVLRPRRESEQEAWLPWQ